jgi:hypothetical protein
MYVMYVMYLMYKQGWQHTFDTRQHSLGGTEIEQYSVAFAVHLPCHSTFVPVNCLENHRDFLLGGCTCDGETGPWHLHGILTHEGLPTPSNQRKSLLGSKIVYILTSAALEDGNMLRLLDAVLPLVKALQLPPPHARDFCSCRPLMSPDAHDIYPLAA